MASSETTHNPSPVHTLLQRQGLRHFIKFCIVGLSSTAIDFVIYLLLMEAVHLPQYLGGNVETARLVAQSTSFLFAVTNGFYWNSRWTFRHTDAAGQKQRYAKFVLTNTIGLGLNLLILSVVARNVPHAVISLLGHYLHDPKGFIGKLAATGVVVFWNFTASKYWTFKK